MFDPDNPYVAQAATYGSRVAAIQLVLSKLKKSENSDGELWLREKLVKDLNEAKRSLQTTKRMRDMVRNGTLEVAEKC